jgi:hypothetical protein
MTGKADFTEEEWELVLDGPPTAGLVAVSAASPGGVRQGWTIVTVYAEARQERGENELLDDLVADSPNLERYASPEDAEREGLARLAEAVALLERKATPGEVVGYKHFTLDVAARVAEEHKEECEIREISVADREAIEKIAAGLNPS